MRKLKGVVGFAVRLLLIVALGYYGTVQLAEILHTEGFASMTLVYAAVIAVGWVTVIVTADVLVARRNIRRMYRQAAERRSALDKLTVEANVAARRAEWEAKKHSRVTE